jgi:NADH-quinone oxidoreductase subunit L
MAYTAMALWLLLLPTAASAAIGLTPAIRKSGRAAGLLSVAAALASFGFAVAIWAQLPGTVIVRIPWLPVGGHPLAELGLRLDGVSALMLVVVGLVALMVQVYSLGYLKGEPDEHIGRYYSYQSLFLLAMQGLVVSPNLLQLFAFWELVGLCSYLLIGYYYVKPSAGKAAVKAFWVNKFGDVGLLAAVILAYFQFGTFDIQAIAAALAGGAKYAAVWQLGALALPLVPLGIFTGVMSKSAQFPLHVWLPDAMEGPTPVSALLHAATMVAAGVYLLVRASGLYGPAALDVPTVILYVGSFTAVFAAVLGMVQDDIKKVLAYSTCSQLGLMVAGIGAGALMGGYFHLFTHAFFKALLFLAAGSVIHGVHTNDMREMGGLFQHMKVTGTLFAIGILALAGIAPFAGFFSKDLILEGLEHHPVAFAMCMSTAFLTPFYMGRAFFLTFVGKPRTHHAEHAHESHAPMLIPMLILAVPAVIAGFYAPAFAERIGAHYHFELGAVGIAGLVLALAGLGVAYVVYGRRAPDLAAAPSPVKAFLRAGYVDRLWEYGYRRLMLVLSSAIAWFDRYIIDGVMNLFGWAALEGGARLRTMQTGQAQDYVFLVFLAVIALAAWGYIGG